MVSSERRVAGAETSKRIIIVVAIVAAVLIGGIFYFLLRATGGGTSQPVISGMLRAGSPDFDQQRSKIVLDDPEADEAKRALGDIVMSLHTTVRNFTGKTIDALEVKGTVVDHQGKPLKEKTVLVIPTRQAELEPNKTMFVQVMLDGLSEKDDRANIKMEVTGIRFKNS